MKNTPPAISIIVPTLNEEKNIFPLLKRIDDSLQLLKKRYEVIFIDDNSSDRTVNEITKLSKHYPVTVFTKIGVRGKAQSLIEGFAHATGEIVTMIDADLQYPPESIPEMYAKIASNESDVVVATRQSHNTNILRRWGSRFNRYATGKFLHNLDCDVQSGLKMFRKEILERVEIEATGWTFDLGFLLAAVDAGYRIDSVTIDFAERTAGESKINFWQTGWEILSSAFKLKFRERKIIPFSQAQEAVHGKGFHFKGRPYVPHTELAIEKTAFSQVTRKQLGVLAVVALGFGLALIFNWFYTVIALISFLTGLYFLDLLFNLFLVGKSLNTSSEIDVSESEIERASDFEWPSYTVFCPLYKEWQVVPQFVEAMQAMDYPKDKLQVMLLLEEDDKTTISKVKKFDLPDYFDVVVVPHSMPKTKPKACNYGLLTATGDYSVIFDAEDIPDPLQLKKAVLAFEKLPADIVCVQAKLHYYNPTYNLLTRFFTAEYSLWFDLILPGLQSVNAPIPLGGTSNHFKTANLRELQGWDPFNVTEDCDLGMRIVKRGWKTGVINSTTMEEANSRPWNWVRQRSRWIKGYMQTYLVHLRDLNEFMKLWPQPHIITFNLVVGVKILALLINPLMWLLTISYYLFRPQVGPVIEEFFPGPVLYMGTFSLVIGNFFYLYTYMIAVSKRREFNLIKYVFLIPIYWLGMSWASWIALYEVFVKPHYWAKTVHGFHLDTSEDEEDVEEEELEEVVVVPESHQSVGTVEQPAIQPNLGLLSWRSYLSSGSMWVLAALMGNALNYLYNTYLARNVSLVEFGTVSLVGSLFYLLQLPLGALTRTMTHQSAFGLGKYHHVAFAFWSKIRRVVIWISVSVSILWVILLPVMNAYFKIDTSTPLMLYTPTLLLSALLAVDSGFLQGALKFGHLAFFVVLEALMKLLFAWLAVEMGYPEWVYFSIPASMVVAWLGIYWVLLSMKSHDTQDAVDEDLTFGWRFYFASILEKLSVVAFLSADIILAKHFLSPEDAGIYGLLSLVGKMVYFIGSLFGQFINPVISHMKGAGMHTLKPFYALMGLISVTSLIGFVVLGLYGDWSVALLFGDRSIEILPYLAVYTLGIAYFTIASHLVLFHQIRKEYIFPGISLLSAVAIVIGIWFMHDTVWDFVTVLTVVSWGYLISVLAMHIYVVAFGGFGKLSESIESVNIAPLRPGMSKIVVFNWRDTKHLWAGGAEVYISKLAESWVKDGHQVTIFCSNDRRNISEEVINGVHIIRKGGFFTVYLWAIWEYWTRLRSSCDVIVDCENGIPFFTPLFSNKPVVLLIHHVHQEVFMKKLRLPWWLLPMAFLAKGLEAFVVPLVYRSVQIATVSESSKEDILELGLGKNQSIEVINPGIDLSFLKPGKKTHYPSVLYLGRLQAYKSVNVLLDAFVAIQKQVPNAMLRIAGIGEAKKHLEKQARRLGIENRVEFLGKVSEEKKRDLLASSWVMVQPSSFEGWGITVLEANACGTCVVASDVPGLRESVRNTETGFLAKWGSSSSFTARILLVLTDRNLRMMLEKNALKWASSFSWDQSARTFFTVLQKAMAIEADKKLSAWQRIVMRTN